MAIMEFRLILLGKESINQSSSYASSQTPIPKVSNCLCIPGAQVSNSGRVSATASFLLPREPGGLCCPKKMKDQGVGS